MGVFGRSPGKKKLCIHFGVEVFQILSGILLGIFFLFLFEKSWECVYHMFSMCIGVLCPEYEKAKKSQLQLGTQVPSKDTWEGRFYSPPRKTPENWFEPSESFYFVAAQWPCRLDFVNVALESIRSPCPFCLIRFMYGIPHIFDILALRCVMHDVTCMWISRFRTIELPLEEKIAWMPNFPRGFEERAIHSKLCLSNWGQNVNSVLQVTKSEFMQMGHTWVQ